MFRVPCQIQWPGSLECSRSFFIHFFMNVVVVLYVVSQHPRTPLSVLSSQTRPDCWGPSTCQSWYLHLFFFIWDSTLDLFFLFEILPCTFSFYLRLSFAPFLFIWDSPSKLLRLWLSNSGLFIREGHIDIDGICSTWKCTAPKTKSAELYLHRIIALSTLYLNTTPSKHNYETYLSVTIQTDFRLDSAQNSLTENVFLSPKWQHLDFQQTLQHFKTIIIQKLSSILP